MPPQTGPPARNGQEVVPHRAAEGVCRGQMGVERGDEGVELGGGDLPGVSGVSGVSGVRRVRSGLAESERSEMRRET